MLGILLEPSPQLIPTHRFDAHTQSVAEFRRGEGVSAPSFYQWRKRLAPRVRPAVEAARFRSLRQL
ncbi:MAG TPA: hypothetical protein P5057_10330, partial [Acidobacteriota bacterium]|nr:hypothetical protein [Acidobacteriota bacterium]